MSIDLLKLVWLTLVIVVVLSFSTAFAMPVSINYSDSLFQKSNSIGDMTWDGKCLWVATDDGISITCDGGLTWRHTLEGKSFSAMIYSYGRILAAASFDAPTDVPVGDGLYRTFSDTILWEYFEPFQLNLGGMLSYDIAVGIFGFDTIQYSANFYGGLTKSSDWCETYINIIWDYDSDTIEGFDGIVIDTLIPDIQDSIRKFWEFNNGSNDRRFFAVAIDTSVDTPVVYAGSAMGIFAIHGDKFTVAYPEDGLLGYWCVALKVQYTNTGSVIWAASRAVNASAGETDGICYSTDYGVSWDTLAQDLWCWNMEFVGDTAYFACEQGFYRSIALSEPEKITIVDSETGQYLPIDQMISVAAYSGTLWIGSDFGLARTTDGCQTFKIFLTREISDRENETYAFPSPFSPYQHGTIFFTFNNPQLGEVKLEILDFALDNLYTKTEVIDVQIGAIIQWDGKDKNGNYPANGIYHYRITRSDGKKLWGKFAFIK